MKSRFFFISLIFASLACVLPTVSIETPPDTSAQVATAVALTLQASTQVAATPVSANAVLPRGLYYMANDNQSVSQVFRVERDGKTITQLTSEFSGVTDYDVSPIDGSIVYESGVQLVWLNADASNRRVLVDGTPNSNNRGYYHPVFSPDGQTIAYRRDGLYLYSVASGASDLVFADHPLGGSLPPEIYQPNVFSPDGTKLLIDIGHPPDSPYTGAIYTLATNVLQQFGGEDQSMTCCTLYGGPQWAADSSAFYTPATIPDSSSIFSVLWKVDANSGAVTQLLPGGAGEGDTRLMYLTYEPYLAPEGHVYFFSAKYPELEGFDRRVPMVIVRADPSDMMTSWTILRGDISEMVNEVLWAPDASFVIVTVAPSADIHDSGRAEILYFDGRPNIVLTQVAKQMKWGP